MWAKLASLQDLSWCWSMPDPKSRLVPPIALFGLDISNSCNGFIGKVTHFNLCRTYMIYYIILYICESSPFCKESSWFEASGCGTSARPHIHIAPAKEKIENEDQHDQNQNHRYPQTSTDLRSSKLFNAHTKEIAWRKESMIWFKRWWSWLTIKASHLLEYKCLSLYHLYITFI